MGTGMDAQHKMDFFFKKKTVYVVITQKNSSGPWRASVVLDKLVGF